MGPTTASLGLARGAAVVCLCAVAPACAALWGFQDGFGASSDGSAEGPDADDEVAPPSEGCSLTCVGAPPAGWAGPYALVETTGAPSAPPPHCSDGPYPVEVYLGMALPSAQDTSCQCACGPPAGSSCDAPTITLSHGGMCSAASQCANVVSSSGCVDLDPRCGGDRMAVSAAAPVPGACEAIPTNGLPAVGWGASARLCAAREPWSGPCAGGQVCTAPATPPFEASYCVAKAELSPCPPGPYAVRRVYYGAVVDTRSCTDCSCGPASMDCVGGTVSTFDAPGCAGPSRHTWSVPQSCTGVGGSASLRYGGDAVPNVGPCTPAGGTPTGALTPANPTTICCTP